MIDVEQAAELLDVDPKFFRKFLALQCWHRDGWRELRDGHFVSELPRKLLKDRKEGRPSLAAKVGSSVAVET
jgi:hypothetical protein